MEVNTNRTWKLLRTSQHGTQNVKTYLIRLQQKDEQNGPHKIIGGELKCREVQGVPHIS